MAQLVGHMPRRWNFYNSRGGVLTPSPSLDGGPPPGGVRFGPPMRGAPVNVDPIVCERVPLAQDHTRAMRLGGCAQERQLSAGPNWSVGAAGGAAHARADAAGAHLRAA